MLSLGSTGPQVRELQDSLNRIFASQLTPRDSTITPLAVDGIYGRVTTSRVRQFQSINSLSVDGIVGSATLGVIQVVLAQLKNAASTARGPYSRFKALTYIATYWNRVASDGKLATRSGYPKQINGVTIKPAMLYADFGNFVTGEEDCTHFMSCVIGQTKGTVNIGGANIQFEGGGLPISQPYAHFGVYGHDTVPNLVAELINRKFAVVVGKKFIPRNGAASEIIRSLKPGDILAYASKESEANYEHLVMVVGFTGANTPDADVKIACHTKIRFNVTYLDIPFPLVTLLQLPN